MNGPTTLRTPRRPRADRTHPAHLLLLKTNPHGGINAASVEPALIHSSFAAERWHLHGSDPAGTLATFDIEVIRAPHARSSAPKVLILPPVGGGTVFDERMLRLLAAEGAEPYLLRRWSGHLETAADPAIHDRGILRGVAAVRQTLSHFGITNAGIYGTSLGGMVASTAAGVDSRINSVVLAVAGGSPVETVLQSEHEILVRLRRERMESFGLENLQDYREFLKRHIHLDAANYTRPDLQDAIWMLIAGRDLSVPTTTQENLWHSWGKPRRTDLRGGHFFAAVTAYMVYGREAARFLCTHAR